MATVLKTLLPHVELYCRQAKGTAGPQQNLPSSIGQITTMTPEDLDEYIGLGLKLFEGLRDESQHVQTQIASGLMPYDSSVSEVFLSAWRDWLEPCDAIETAVRSLETQGISLRNASKFRQSVQEVKLQPADMAALAEADENMLAGRGVSLDAALRGLRAHCRS
jgi:hypothetical protein